MMGTLARIVCVLLGLVLIAAGALGFTVDASFDEARLALDFEGTPVQGDRLLGFEVNGWHNVVHLATGAILLLGGLSRATAGGALLAFGLIYVAVTVIGFVDGRSVLGVIPVNTADNYLHAALAAVGVLVGVLGLAGGRDRAKGRDRRSRSIDPDRPVVERHFSS